MEEDAASEPSQHGIFEFEEESPRIRAAILRVTRWRENVDWLGDPDQPPSPPPGDVGMVEEDVGRPLSRPPFAETTSKRMVDYGTPRRSEDRHRRLDTDPIKPILKGGGNTPSTGGRSRSPVKFDTGGAPHPASRRAGSPLKYEMKTVPASLDAYRSPPKYQNFEATPEAPAGGPGGAATGHTSSRSRSRSRTIAAGATPADFATGSPKKKQRANRDFTIDRRQQQEAPLPPLPVMSDGGTPTSIAERRSIVPPIPIDIDAAQQYESSHVPLGPPLTVVHRIKAEVNIPVPRSGHVVPTTPYPHARPETPPPLPSMPLAKTYIDDSPSVYSDDPNYEADRDDDDELGANERHKLLPAIRPLHIRRVLESPNRQSVLKSYSEWAAAPVSPAMEAQPQAQAILDAAYGPGPTLKKHNSRPRFFIVQDDSEYSAGGASIGRAQTVHHSEPSHAKSQSEPEPHIPETRSTGDVVGNPRDADQDKISLTAAAGASDDPYEMMYTPLAPYMSSKDMPGHFKKSKVLIGNNGWLERPGGRPEQVKPSPPKKDSFFDNLKKKAKEMVEKSEIKSNRRSRESSDKGKDKDKRSTSYLAISLDPRMQSLLYCELEFALACALNSYIQAQFNAGRLDPDKLKRVADAWAAQGRPKVVSFRYDLETQLELVRLHVADFRFYGRPQTATTQVLGMLDMMKADARAMRVRTFCSPDTVIAKQLFDAQNLFNTLGSPEPAQIKLAEVCQFFKACMERERVMQQRAQEEREGGGRGNGGGDGDGRPMTTATTTTPGGGN